MDSFLRSVPVYSHFGNYRQVCTTLSCKDCNVVAPPPLLPGVIRGQVLFPSSGIAFLTGQQLSPPVSTPAWARGTVTANDTSLLVSLSSVVPGTNVQSLLVASGRVPPTTLRSRESQCVCVCVCVRACVCVCFLDVEGRVATYCRAEFAVLLLWV
jgi:hypothetical protein